MVTELNSENFKDFLSKNKIVLVDFWAEWCGPCKIMEPVFKQLEEDMKDLAFGKLDVDANQEIASQNEVMSIPTTIIFHEGKEVERIIGFSPKPVYKAKIEGVIKNLA